MLKILDQFMNLLIKLQNLYLNIIYYIYCLLINNLKSRNNKIPMDQNSNQQDYNLYHIEKDIRSLTITKKPKQILRCLISKAKYLWIMSNRSSNLDQKQKIHKQCEMQVQEKFQFVSDISSAMNFVENQKLIVVVCSQSFLIDFLIQSKIHIESGKVLKIFCYGADNNSSKIIKPLIIYVNDQKQAIKKILQNKQNHIKRNDFVNFIQIDNDIQNSNITLCTMFVMINQKTNREYLLRDFKELAELYCPQKDKKEIEQFFCTYSKGTLGIKQAIKWYTKQCFLYSLLNSILRLCKQLTQVYIVQPFFQDLFKSIKNLYKDQQQNNISSRNFICYRGAKISTEQFNFFQKNNGMVIQNLGFFSTSTLKKIAQNYKLNTLFEIQIQYEQRQSQLDSGYAFVSKLSSFKLEQEVIFNPLNSFKILLVSIQKDNTYRIKLRYGELARITAKNRQEISQEQSIYKYIGENQVWIIQKSCSIAMILVQQSFSLKGSQLYCKECLSIAEQSKDQYLLAAAYQIVGRNEGNKGNFKQKIDHYKKSLEITKNIFGQSSIQFVHMLSNIGSAYFQALDYIKSIQCDQRCENILKMQGRIGVDYSMVLKKLGTSYYKIGESKKAQKLLKNCLKIFKFQLGNKHPQYVNTLQLLASIYLSYGYVNKSIKINQYCQRIYRKTKGQNHIWYLRILNSLGIAYLKESHTSKAYQCLQKCEEIQRITLGQRHQQYLVTLNSLGAYYMKIKEFDKAINYFLRCKKLSKSNLITPNLASAINNLGQVYFHLLQFQKAIQCFQQSLQMQSIILGQKHPNYAITLNNLASAYKKLNQFQKALVYNKRCQKIQRQALGQGHPTYAKTLGNLGSTLKNLGQLQSAASYFHKSQKILRITSGQNNESYTISINNLGSIYYHLKDYKKSLQYLEKCLNIQKNVLGENHEDYILTQKYIHIVKEAIQQEINQGTEYKKDLQIKKHINSVIFIDFIGL